MTPIGSFPGELAAARSTKGRTGSGGCSLPSDSLTAEEIRKLNGEVKTVRLRPGIVWAELCALSDRMQTEYLKVMIEHGARPKTLGKMLGVSDQSVRLRMQALGLPLDKQGVSHTVIDGMDKQWDEWCAKCSEEDKAKEEKEVDRKAIEDALRNCPVTLTNVTTVTTMVTKGANVIRGYVGMTGTAEEILTSVREMLPTVGRLWVNIEYKHMEDTHE